MALFKNKKLLILGIAVLAAVGVAVLVFLLVKPEAQEPVPTTTAPTTQATTTATTVPETTQPTTAPTESGETLPPAVWQTTPQMEATYEQWLAAAMYLLIPLEYPDFQIQEIYAASQTDLSDRLSSLGVYVCLQREGEQIWIHSAPLADNRSEKGTTDLHTAQLGYATFDAVEAVDVSAMTQLTLDDLVEPMEYTMLPGLTVN